MSELTLVLIRFAYLAILWILVLSCISVIRSDMFGSRAPRETTRGERRRQRSAQKSAQKASRPSRPRRGEPTAVAVLEGSNAGETVSLEHAPLLIGRGQDAAIRLDDDYVSTRHARIGASGEQWYVEDLGSTNGTYVGSSRITQPTAIQLGTRVRIGKTVLELRK